MAKDAAQYEAMARLEKLDSEAVDLAQRMVANLSVRITEEQHTSEMLQADKGRLEAREPKIPEFAVLP